MTNKVLSVEEARDDVLAGMSLLAKNGLVDALISAVRREERDKLLCSKCGFPKELKREPIFLSNDIFSLLQYEDNACEECKHQKDGSTISVVARKIREVAEVVRKRERERAVRIIDSELKIPFENYLDVKKVKEKILEEK